MTATIHRLSDVRAQRAGRRAPDPQDERIAYIQRAINRQAKAIDEFGADADALEALAARIAEVERVALRNLTPEIVEIFVRGEK